MKAHHVALPVLVIFSLYTGWTLITSDQSLFAFGAQLISRPDTAQVVIDLYLMAALACVWMLNDSQSRGDSLQSVLPYLLLTLIFVSVGPLLYIVIKGMRNCAGAPTLNRQSVAGRGSFQETEPTAPPKGDEIT